MSARQRKRGERPVEDDRNVSGAPVVPAEVPFKSTAWVEQRDAAARSHRSRPNKNLSQILNGENYHLLPCDHPTYDNIRVGPSFKPKTKFCDITGFPAPYTDPQTGLYFADIEAYQLILTLSEDEIQKLLALRGASRAIT